MLDDLKYIHAHDAQDALGIVGRQSGQLLHDFEIAPIAATAVTNIVYVGMGGSALAAFVSAVWPGFSLPFEIVRGYDLPKYVSETTLCIIASYSGNTEETLSALEQAEQAGARIAVIAGGGALTEAARSKGYPLAVLPPAQQPRYAVLYNFRALLDILTAANIIDKDKLYPQLEMSAHVIDESVTAWLPEVPSARNPAKQLAQELMGRSVVIYAGPKMFPAAYKWKISCNENAKQIAWTGVYPEFNHNEFIGWSKQPVDKPYAIVDIRSDLEHPRVRHRFAVSERLLSGMRPVPNVVEPRGDTLLDQLLWTSVYGDFVTIYLALQNGLNPAPVDLVEKFKKEL